MKMILQALLYLPTLLAGACLPRHSSGTRLRLFQMTRRKNVLQSLINFGVSESNLVLTEKGREAAYDHN